MRYLDAELIGFAIAMATLVAWLVVLVTYLSRRGISSSKSSASGGILVGILAPLLCCSPILPITMAFIATAFPVFIGNYGWRLQAFIATNQTEIFSFAVLLLILSVYQNSKRVVEGAQCHISRSAMRRANEKYT